MSELERAGRVGLLGLGIALVGCAGAARGGRAPAGQACDGLPLIRFSEHLCAGLAADSKRITLRARHRTQIAAGQQVQLVCMESRRRWRAVTTFPQ